MADTVLLLHMDNLVDPVTYVDSSSAPNVVTPFPALTKPIQQSAVAKFTGAMSLNGTSQYLQVNNNSAFQFTGDFTIECRVYLNTYGDISMLWNHSAGVTERITLYTTPGTGLVRFQLTKLGVVEINLVGAQIPLSSWHHVALTRNGSTMRLYLDGVIQSTDTTGEVFPTYSTNPLIGNDEYFANYLDGYIDEFRISGIARYGADNFTPSTTAFPIAVATNYCTVAQVIEVAQKYENDLDDNNDYGPGATSTLPTSEVTGLILEAQHWVNNILYPRYNVIAIQALDPDYPPMVNYMCKLRTAILLYNRATIADPDNSNARIVMILENELNNIVNTIVNGMLYDIDGVIIASLAGPLLQKQPIYTSIGTLYTNGNRSY